MTVIKIFIYLMCNLLQLVTKESSRLKPDWFCDIKLFLVKNLNMLSYNNLSNILPETGSKGIGRQFLRSFLLFFKRQELHWIFSIQRGTSHFLNTTKKLFLVVCKYINQKILTFDYLLCRNRELCLG